MDMKKCGSISSKSFPRYFLGSLFITRTAARNDATASGPSGVVADAKKPRRTIVDPTPTALVPCPCDTIRSNTATHALLRVVPLVVERALCAHTTTTSPHQGKMTKEASQ
eukprot:m.296374 g.296374  ORF g.296374 m.296374 type:complete len:110 (+) comp16273_c0_seq38:3236-3565(+)